MQTDPSVSSFRKKKLFVDSAVQVSAKHQADGIKRAKVQSDHTECRAQELQSFQIKQELIEALARMGYTAATPIQSESLKHSLQGADLLCLSETGSGKTLSFLIPIIDYLLGSGQTQGIALILVPTRELCQQIQEYLVRFQEQGLSACTSVALHGGVDTKMKQVLELIKKPSIVVGTPGRVLDHLQTTQGFHLRNLKYLVLDEADKLLNLDFEKQINQIMAIVPKQRNAYLYSATLTSKVEKLQRVSLSNPIRIEINTRYQTVANLEEFYIFIPSKWKDCYLVHLLNLFREDKCIIFTKTCLGAERLYLVLKQLKMRVECLHGDLSQGQRARALSSFKQEQCKFLVCTDVASRGLDISAINTVINFDLCTPKDYIHRVGRTARIGKSGKAVSIVTQYDVEAFQEIQKKLGRRVKELETKKEEALLFLEVLENCHRQVSLKMKRNKKKLY